MAGDRKGLLGDHGAALRTHGNGYAQQMRATEDRLTEESKIKRQLFVAHYLDTLDKKASAGFAGFSSPAIKAQHLLREPYVQFLMKETLNKLKNESIMSAQEILFQAKKEAMDEDDGNKGARISALTLIAKMQGLLVLSLIHI
mgnify:FL=1